jgi:hypothetical protein
MYDFELGYNHCNAQIFNFITRQNNTSIGFRENKYWFPSKKG